jgi:PAS domain S-box-containing protein
LTRLVAADGTTRDVIVTSQIVEWNGENRLFTVLQDLTEFQRTQTQLSLSDSRYKLFFDSVPLPVFTYDIETLRIIDANAAAISRYGYSREELLSLTILDIRSPEERSLPLPISDGLPGGVDLGGSWKHRWKDGTIRDVYVNGYSLILDGRRTELNIIQDVTDQLAIQKALETSEQRMRIIADVATDAIWDVDFQTEEVIFTNGLDTSFGHDPSKPSSIEWWASHIHPDDQEEVLRGFDQAVEGGGFFWSARYRFQRADGEYAHVIDRGVIIRDPQSRPVRMIGTMVDITRQVEIQEATTLATLEERQRLARDLHDAVTQSLYSLTLMAEAARRRAQVGDMVAAHEFIDRLGQLAQQSLKEMRLLVYELSPTALKEKGLAGALQARLDAVERRAGIHADLQMHLTRELSPEIQIQLYRIAEEALNNALKHAQASSVTLEVASNDHGVTLRISDNGIGFENHVMNPSGGLGLTNMQDRAAKLGGKLEIESAPGEGTTILFNLKSTESNHDPKNTNPGV